MWLKLQWARFFTLAGWEWNLSPRQGLDFRVTFPCGHSECNGSHTLFVRVIERSLEALVKSHGTKFSTERIWTEPHPALFGDGLANTYWVMSHGAGGGSESVRQWIPEAAKFWQRAAHE